MNAFNTSAEAEGKRLFRARIAMVLFPIIPDLVPDKVALQTTEPSGEAATSTGVAQ